MNNKTQTTSNNQQLCQLWPAGQVLKSFTSDGISRVVRNIGESDVLEAWLRSHHVKNLFSIMKKVIILWNVCHLFKAIGWKISNRHLRTFWRSNVILEVLVEFKMTASWPSWTSTCPRVSKKPWCSNVMKRHSNRSSTNLYHSASVKQVFQFGQQTRACGDERRRASNGGGYIEPTCPRPAMSFVEVAIQTTDGQERRQERVWKSSEGWQGGVPHMWKLSLRSRWHL